jgi:hypothetical protein
MRYYVIMFCHLLHDRPELHRMKFSDITVQSTYSHPTGDIDLYEDPNGTG